MVTVTVDIGTSVVPLALPDAAIAYALQYKQGSKATLFIKMYTASEKVKGNTPQGVFEDTVKGQPNVWNTTYAALDSLLSLKAVEDKFSCLKIELEFDEKEYTWSVKTDAVKDWMMSLALGRDIAPIDAAVIAADQIKF